MSHPCAALGAWAVAFGATASIPRVPPGVAFDDYVARDALGLAPLVATGQAGAAELLETTIARAEAVPPKLDAIATQPFDRPRPPAL